MNGSMEEISPYHSAVHSKAPSQVYVSEMPSTTASVNHDRKSTRTTTQPQAFSRSFFGKGDEELAMARTIYLKTVVPGVVLVAITILAVFSIFWGSAWKIPDHTLPGWIVVRAFSGLFDA